jgi:WhiB family redox-sensing transcriptional regulator
VTADWRDRGLCLTPAHAPLFADRRPLGYTRQRQNKEAKAVCERCPSREPCLAEAMDEEEQRPASHRDGIRGGLDAGQRAALARNQQQ